MEEEKEFTVSYATLFELLRRERDREDLQKLVPTFIQDVRNYVKDQKLAAERAETSEEKHKVEKEILNLKKIIHQIYDRRERKIVNMSLDKSRIKTNIIDTAAMLEQEKALFQSLLDILNKNREYNSSLIFEDKPDKRPETHLEPKEEEKKQDEEKKDKILVRFTKAVPRFVGKELEEYGPFEEEDMANLPEEIAKVLIEKSRAEEISQ